jgi:hypothetical protein
MFSLRVAVLERLCSSLFRVRVAVMGYSLHSPVSPSRLLIRAELCHHIVIGLYFEKSPHRFTSSANPALPILFRHETLAYSYTNIVWLRLRYYLIKLRPWHDGTFWSMRYFSNIVTTSRVCSADIESGGMRKISVPTHSITFLRNQSMKAPVWTEICTNSFSLHP